MTAIPIRPLTPEQYLAIERASEIRQEYIDGEVFAMAGGTEPHNLIAGNLLGEFRNQLKNRGCRVYPSDMRVQVPGRKLYAYPDVVVVCGQPEFADELADTLLNPIVIVEVLSDSTENFDRGKKFQRYRKILSLREYVLVAQDRCYIEHFVRQSATSWNLTEITDPAGSLTFPSLGCEVPLAEIYAQVEFPPTGLSTDDAPRAG